MKHTKGRKKDFGKRKEGMLETDDFHCRTIPVIRDFSLNPSCDHGPTVLFDRMGKRFFACSAFRSRKICPFYLPEDNWNPQKPTDDKAQKATGQKSQLGKRKNAQSHEKEDVPVPSNKRLKVSATGKNLPVATQRNQGEAQFHFTDETVQFFIDQFRNLGIDSILCIGTPSLHEYIKERSGELKMKSFFLDIDDRFEKKNTAKEFALYNLVNHHFFGGESVEYKYFLRKSNHLAIVTDPPFGVKVELIWNGCLKGVQKDLFESKSTKDENIVEPLSDIFWVFPYFNEGHILNKCSESGLKMSDFPVEYVNHAKFTGKKNNKSSPVRVFTTVSLADVKLPYETYRYCDFCSKWVAKKNVHCSLCGICPTKDGGNTYVHCKKCKKCVKPTWIHCASPCGTCHLQDAPCRPEASKSKNGKK